MKRVIIIIKSVIRLAAVYKNETVSFIVKDFRFKTNLLKNRFTAKHYKYAF